MVVFDPILKERISTFFRFLICSELYTENKMRRQLISSFIIP